MRPFAYQNHLSKYPKADYTRLLDFQPGDLVTFVNPESSRKSPTFIVLDVSTMHPRTDVMWVSHILTGRVMHLRPDVPAYPKK